MIFSMQYFFCSVIMASLQSDITELAYHLQQERLFIESEKKHLLSLNDQVILFYFYFIYILEQLNYILNGINSESINLKIKQLVKQNIHNKSNYSIVQT